MEDKGSTATTRTSLLRRGLVLAGVAFGYGAAKADARPMAAAPARKPETLKLHGQNWSIQAPGLKQGKVPARGERTAMYGELLARPGGKKVGEFYSAHFSTLSPFGKTPFAAGGVEMHTFNLEGGTLVGMGSHWGEAGTYAIVGGTGRYLGARGGYVARQNPFQLGGDGTAEFTIDLIA